MNEQQLTLQVAHEALGWPTPAEVCHPPGAGPAVFAELVRAKIGRELSRFPDAADAVIGILAADPYSEQTEPPLAIAVEFARSASPDTLRELHRLAWNFSHAPSLITLEPDLLRVWSCCEAPDEARELDTFVVQQLASDEACVVSVEQLQTCAAQALHWINLASGEFFSEYADRFKRDGRADQRLLSNLHHLRENLRTAGLTDDDVCHDLLARTIFVQFLFDRKDADGTAALNRSKLHKLHGDGTLKHRHDTFSDLLGDYADTYRLFDWLNERFNGDLFPGKGDSPTAREAGWRREKRVVTPAHLKLLSEFIDGTLDLPSGQRSLWPVYAFDVIPLEFISSIYETFVSEKAGPEGIFYTPPHLVDFVLDRVLPWRGQQWDVRVLDPACGSGIFLVKAFQRLAHRWKKLHPGQTIRTDVLKRLLERNVLGVDKDPHAVRVACFSLYLAMCDEVEPRHYWTHIVFPSMRGRRLIASDFFSEESTAIATDAAAYDLIVGNAPWGDRVITTLATEWASTNGWPVGNHDIGALFLAKSGRLLAPDGRIAMIQSANGLLLNVSGPTRRFREKLLATYAVEEIYNLAAIRFRLFKGKGRTRHKSVAPTCVIIMRAAAPQPHARIAYITPKHLKPLVDEFAVVVEPADRKFVSQFDACNDPMVWTSLMWGAPRDRQLLRRLMRGTSLARLERDQVIETREGMIWGNQQKAIPALSDRRVLSDPDFPDGDSLYLRADDLPIRKSISVDAKASTDFSAFRLPQLLIKQTWRQSASRLQARLVDSSDGRGVLCTQSYMTVTGPEDVLRAAAVVFSSSLAVYTMMLVSARLTAYRPEMKKGELMGMPLPEVGLSEFDSTLSVDDIDALAFDLMRLSEPERALVEDMCTYTLASFRGDPTEAERSTMSVQGRSSLDAYCRFFSRVLKAGFGADRPVRAVIFEDDSERRLPYRLVAFELGGRDEVDVRRITNAELIQQLEMLNRTESARRGLYARRVARIYDAGGAFPTIYMVKPDKVRYWTRSAALNDADEAAADLFEWFQHMPKKV